MSSKILLLCTTTGVTALRSDTNTDQAGGADSSGSALPPCSTLSWWSRPFTKCATESTAQVTTTTTPGQENGSALPQCSTLSWWSRPFTKCAPESTAHDQVTTSAAPVEEAPEAQDAKTTPAQETTTPPVAQAPKKSKLTFKEAVSSVFRNTFRKKEKKKEDPTQFTKGEFEKKTMWDRAKNFFSFSKKEKKPENSLDLSKPKPNNATMYPTTVEALLEVNDSEEVSTKATVAAEEDTSNMNDSFTVDALLKANDSEEVSTPKSKLTFKEAVSSVSRNPFRKKEDPAPLFKLVSTRQPPKEDKTKEDKTKEDKIVIGSPAADIRQEKPSLRNIQNVGRKVVNAVTVMKWNQIQEKRNEVASIQDQIKTKKTEKLKHKKTWVKQQIRKLEKELAEDFKVLLEQKIQKDPRKIQDLEAKCKDLKAKGKQKDKELRKQERKQLKIAIRKLEEEVKVAETIQVQLKSLVVALNPSHVVSSKKKNQDQVKLASLVDSLSK